jgi:hypothetical protein
MDNETEISAICDELKYIREDLVEALDKVVQAESGKKFFDPELTSVIKGVISGVIEKLLRVERPIINIDMKPIEKLASIIVDQNENILKVLSEASSESDDFKYQELLKKVLELVNNSNEFFGKEIKQPDYSNALSKLADSNKRPVVKYLAIERNRDGSLSKVIPVYNT